MNMFVHRDLILAQLTGLTWPTHSWTSNPNNSHEVYAHSIGMTCKPYDSCASMARRIPHFSGLTLLQLLIPLYWANHGDKEHFEFGMNDPISGNHRWLFKRSPHNDRDEVLATSLLLLLPLLLLLLVLLPLTTTTATITESLRTLPGKITVKVFLKLDFSKSAAATLS